MKVLLLLTSTQITITEVNERLSASISSCSGQIFCCCCCCCYLKKSDQLDQGPWLLALSQTHYCMQGYSQSQGAKCATVQIWAMRVNMNYCYGFPAFYQAYSMPCAATCIKRSGAERSSFMGTPEMSILGMYQFYCQLVWSLQIYLGLLIYFKHFAF